MTAWYVVHTRPGSESRAEYNLRRQGFDTYVPMFLRTKRHARKVETVPTPLFPRYIFAGVNQLAKSWRPMFSTFGVSKLVSFGETPVEVPKRVLNSIKDRESKDGYIGAWDKGGIGIGDKVRFADGLMGDKLARITELNSNDRVTLLMEMMGRQVRIRAPLASLTSIS